LEKCQQLELVAAKGQEEQQETIGMLTQELMEEQQKAKDAIKTIKEKLNSNCWVR